MGVLDKIKNIFMLDDNSDYEDEYEYEEYEEDIRSRKAIPTKRKKEEYYEEEYAVAKKESVFDKYKMKQDKSKDRLKEVNSNYSRAKAVVTILNPRDMKDSSAISDALIKDQIVIVNMKSANFAGTQQRILDFISGTVYTKGATLQRITDLIYLVVPSNVDLDSKDETVEDMDRTEYMPLSNFPTLN